MICCWQINIVLSGPLLPELTAANLSVSGATLGSVSATSALFYSVPLALTQPLGLVTVASAVPLSAFGSACLTAVAAPPLLQDFADPLDTNLFAIRTSNASLSADTLAPGCGPRP